MKYIFTLILITVSLSSFSSQEKMLEHKLSFNASTMIVDEFFFKTDDISMSDEKWDARDFDFKIKNIKCKFSTPTYFYEMRYGCYAEYEGAEINLNMNMSTILMASIPSSIHGGDAAGSLYYMIDELDCKGRSRSSSCSMKFIKYN